MKMILTAGTLSFLLMLAAIGAVHAVEAPQPPDEGIVHPLLSGD